MSKTHPYDDPNKQVARDEMWGIFADLTSCQGDALMFPGPRRHEFDTAIRHGYKSKQLILVESDAAVKANFTRQFPKKERPQLQWRFGKLSAVSYELSEINRKVTVAHLDFCKPLSFFHSDASAVEIEKFIKSCVMEDGLLGITVLGGREQDGTHSDEDRYRKMQTAVKRCLHVGIPRTAKLIARGKYQNRVKHNPMIWGIFRIERA